MKMKQLSFLGFALVLASCSEKKETTDNESSDKGSLTEFILSEMPADPIGIAELRTSANPGDQVTFSGKIIGADPVFIDHRAVMIMGDPEKLTSCDLKPDDQCEAPWDVCCDEPGLIKASIVTVQVVDKNGKPLKNGFKGVAGIKELSSLVITGEVAEGSNKENMLVNARGIFVQP